MKDARLQAISDFLTPLDRFIDIGTDHAYIPIYMAKLGSKKILATDIHKNALAIAKQNIFKENLTNVIDTLLSDGLEKVDPRSYDTLVIAGMGTATIKHILSEPEKLQSIRKIIVQTNNHLSQLRIFMNQIGYRLVGEKIVKERKHYYVVMCYLKGNQVLSKSQYALGLYDVHNQEYYEYLYQKYTSLLSKVPAHKQESVKEILAYLTEYLEKKDRIV